MSVTTYPAVRFDRMSRKQAITTCLALEDMRDRAVDEVERLKVALARVAMLADQYAATAEVHAKVRDTIPHDPFSRVALARAAALAGMAQHHADQLRTAIADT